MRDADGTEIKIGDKVMRATGIGFPQIENPINETVTGFLGCAVLTNRHAYVGRTLTVVRCDG